MAVKADAPRTMVGPDHAAARVVIIIGVIIRIIVAADEVAMVVVREAEAAVMKPAMMETAAMEAANVHAAAVPAATAVMETSAVEAATAHTAATHVTAPATMSPAAAAMSADFDHRCAGCGSCRGRRAGTDRRHRLGATTWRGGEQHHCCRSNAEAADKAAPWIGNPPQA
jgi:phage terminase small subunit